MGACTPVVGKEQEIDRTVEGPAVETLGQTVLDGIAQEEDLPTEPPDAQVAGALVARARPAPSDLELQVTTQDEVGRAGLEVEPSGGQRSPALSLIHI